MRKTGEITAVDLEALRATLASFRYDPNLSCYPTADQKIEKRPLIRVDSSSGYPEDSVEGKEFDAARGFSLRRASGACVQFYKLFVPIGCFLAKIDGKPVFLVDLCPDRDRALTSESIEQLAFRVAEPWCFETRSAAKAPKLVFHLDATTDTFSEYSCTEMRLGKKFEGKLQVDPYKLALARLLLIA